MATIPESEVKEYFALVDAEGTGHIRGDQIEVLLRALGFAPTKAEIDSYGIVDLKGFLAIIPKKRIPITKDAIRSALDALNAKTVVTKDVLRQLLTQVGDKLTDAEFEEFVSDPALEATPDGRINVKNIIEVLGA